MKNQDPHQALFLCSCMVLIPHAQRGNYEGARSVEGRGVGCHAKNISKNVLKTMKNTGKHLFFIGSPYFLWNFKLKKSHAHKMCKNSNRNNFRKKFDFFNRKT